MGAFVQAVETDADPSAGTIVSPSITGTAGNMYWFCIGYTNATAEQTATYSGNLTGAVETGHIYDATDDFGMRWGYVKNISGGAATGTATFSANCTFRSIYIQERSGHDTVNPSGATSVVSRQANPGSGTDAITSGNLTPNAQPGSLIGFVLDFTVASTPVAGTGFTSRTGCWDYGSATPSVRPEDKELASTSPVAATATAFTGRGADTYYTIADFYLDAGAGGAAGSLLPWLTQAQNEFMAEEDFEEKVV